MTNFEKIKNMTSEEFSIFLIKKNICDCCAYDGDRNRCDMCTCQEGLNKWLDTERIIKTMGGKSDE